MDNGGFIVVSATDDYTEEPIKGLEASFKLLANNNTRIEITAMDSISKEPIENVTVSLTLINFVNGPSDENVGGLLVRNETVRPELFVDGNYTITLQREDYVSVETGFAIDSFKTYENPKVALEIDPSTPV